MLQPSVPARFEIPVADIDRAQRFHEALLGMSMKRQRYMGDTDAAGFPNGGSGHASDTLIAIGHVRDSEGDRVGLAALEVA